MAYEQNYDFSALHRHHSTVYVDHVSVSVCLASRDEIRVQLLYKMRIWTMMHYD